MCRNRRIGVGFGAAMSRYFRTVVKREAGKGAKVCQTTSYTLTSSRCACRNVPLGASVGALKAADFLATLCQFGCILFAACGVGEKAVEKLANRVVKPTLFIL